MIFDTQLYFLGFATFNLFKLLKISSPDALVANISAPRSINTEVSGEIDTNKNIIVTLVVWFVKYKNVLSTLASSALITAVCNIVSPLSNNF